MKSLHEYCNVEILYVEPSRLSIGILIIIVAKIHADYVARSKYSFV